MKAGDLVFNERRSKVEVKPGTFGSSALGLVDTRPDMDLPLYEGLAVWVRYVTTPSVLTITLLSDLTLVTTGPQHNGVFQPQTWRMPDGFQPHQYTDRSTAEERVSFAVQPPPLGIRLPREGWGPAPTTGGGTGFYGAFLDEMDEVWNTPHASDSAIDMSAADTACSCFDCIVGDGIPTIEPWYVRAGRRLARRAHKALEPVVDKMEAWGWN